MLEGRRQSQQAAEAVDGGWRWTSNVRILGVGASRLCWAFQRVMASSRNPWKLVVFTDVPGMKRAGWRWKLSMDVVPRAHRRTGSWTPPFLDVPVTEYKATPGGSCRHATCHRCSPQIAVMSSLSRGMPSVLVASVSRGMPSVLVASASARSSVSMAATVASVPRVLQQCSASSSQVIAFRTASSDGEATPVVCRVPLFARCSSWWFAASHSNTQTLHEGAIQGVRLARDADYGQFPLFSQLLSSICHIDRFD